MNPFRSVRTVTNASGDGHVDWQAVAGQSTGSGGQR